MKIPVFVSCPTSLSPAQEAKRQLIALELEHFGLEPRALGRSDYATEYPLREVYVIAKHCSGGVILGFEQFAATQGGTWKGGTEREFVANGRVCFPSAWNNLEAGLLFGLRLPLLVFRENGISGGVFDNGVTDAFVHDMPKSPLPPGEVSSLRNVFLKWQAKVREHYYA